MNTRVADIENLIALHAEGHPKGKRESHDMLSLSARVLAPVGVIEKLLGFGIIRSKGPVHRADETGFHSFSSDHLNEVRLSVLTAIAERVIEESDSPDHVTLAVENALRDHAKNFEAKPVTEREFSRFPAGLVQLSRYYEEEPGFLRRTASTVGKVAAVGALGYGAAALLRGRKINPTGTLVDQFRKGSAANIVSGKAMAGKLSAGAAKVADVLAGSRRPR